MIVNRMHNNIPVCTSVHVHVKSCMLTAAAQVTCVVGACNLYACVND